MPIHLKSLALAPAFLCLSFVYAGDKSAPAGKNEAGAEAVKTTVKHATDILDFNAISDGRRVFVNWASLSEKRYDHYTIEKSKDGTRFETAATIKSGGNIDLVDYVDIDYSPYTGISYYRLKQTDLSGAEFYSDMVIVNYQFSNDGTVVSCRDFDPIDMTQVDKQEILVVLRDTKGAEYVSKVVLTENGSNGSLAATDTKNKLVKGTYTVLASSYNRLFGQNLAIR